MILDHKETEVSNEVQLIERYRKASQTCTPNLTDSPVGVGLAALVAAQGIIEAIERLNSTLAETNRELKNIARFV